MISYKLRRSMAPTLSERRNQIALALVADPARSDRDIAAECGVSRELVRRVRTAVLTCGAITEPGVRRGRDGRTYHVSEKPHVVESHPDLREMRAE
jgi:hypothetical protein